MKKKFYIIMLLFIMLFLSTTVTSTLALNDYKDLGIYNRIHTSVGYGSLGIDKGIENGEKIYLKWEDEKRYFNKGFVAHANSKLIFVINDATNPNIYDEFRCYIGNLYQRRDLGDGVKFVIKTGVKKEGAAGTNEGHFIWTEVYNTGKIFKGITNAEYLKIDIKNKDAICLISNQNGNKASDHSTYAFPILCMSNYSEENPTYVKKASAYEAELKDFDFQNQDILSIKQELLNYYIVKNIGYYNLIDFGNTSPQHKEFLTFIFSDNELKRQFVLGGAPRDNKFLESFNVLYRLYSERKADLTDNTTFTNSTTIKKDLYAKMMASLALEFGYGVRPKYGKVREFDTAGNPRIDNADFCDPIERYDVYKELRQSVASAAENNHPLMANELFDSLPAELMRWVFDGQMYNDEIKWLNYQSRKKKNFDGNFSIGGYDFLQYTDPDAHTKLIKEKRLCLPGDPISEANFAIYDAKYELSKFGITNDSNIRYWIPRESGQVCGGISFNGRVTLNSAGFPASVCGQPGHGAYVNYYFDSKRNTYRWKIDNNISGWQESEKNERLPLDIRPKNYIKRIEYNLSHLFLIHDILNNELTYEKVLLLNILAKTITDSQRRLDLYKKLLSIQDKNYQTWINLVMAYKDNNELNDSKALELFNNFLTEFDYYPMALFDMVALLEQCNLNGATIFEIKDTYLKQLRYIRDNRRKDFLYDNEVKNIAKYYLNEENPVATFSFSGEKANTIVVNPQYHNSSFILKYSFDGGETFTEVQKNEVLLTDEEIKKITTKGITIGFIGTCATYVIDIKQSNIPNTISFNPITRTFSTSTDNMEWSFDNNKFYDFSNKPLYENYDRIYLRYVRHDNYLSSPSKLVKYNFMPTAIDNTSVMVKLAPSGENNINIQDILNGTSNLYIAKETEKPEIILAFTNPVKLASIIIAKRSDGGNKDIITYIKLESSLNGKFFDEIGKFENHNINTPLEATFTPITTNYLKITILDTNSSNPSIFSLSQILFNKIELDQTVDLYCNETGEIELHRLSKGSDTPTAPAGFTWIKNIDNINQLISDTELGKYNTIKNYLNENQELSAIKSLDFQAYTGLNIFERNSHLLDIINNIVELTNKQINTNTLIQITLQYNFKFLKLLEDYTITFIPYKPTDSEKVKYFNEDGNLLIAELLVTDPQPELPNSNFQWYKVDDQIYQQVLIETISELNRIFNLLKDPLTLQDTDLLDLTTNINLEIEEHANNILNISDAKQIRLNQMFSHNVTTTLCVVFKRGKIYRHKEQTITFISSHLNPNKTNLYYDENGNFLNEILASEPKPILKSEDYLWHNYHDNKFIMITKDTLSEIEKLQNLPKNVELLSFEKYNINTNLKLKIGEKTDNKLSISDYNISLVNHKTTTNQNAVIHYVFDIGNINILHGTITFEFKAINTKDENKLVFYNELGDKVTHYIPKSSEKPDAGEDFVWYQVNSNSFQLIKKTNAENISKLKELLKQPITLSKDKKEFIIPKELLLSSKITLKNANGFKIQDDKIILVDDKKTAKDASATIEINIKKGLIEEVITQTITFKQSQLLLNDNFVIPVIIVSVLVVVITVVSIVIAVVVTKKKKTVKK